MGQVAFYSNFVKPLPLLPLIQGHGVQVLEVMLACPVQP